MHRPHILLIDDHALFRNGLRLLLVEGIPDVRVSEADSLETVLSRQNPAPDLILLDIRLPGLSGLEGTVLLKQNWPKTTILILSGLTTSEAMAEAQSRGADGYISKAETADCIFESIRTALGTQFAPALKGSSKPKPHLTSRQREILDHLSRGGSNKQIARTLSISENTVRRHVQGILEHFGVESRAEAVFAARQRGVIG